MIRAFGNYAQNQSDYSVLANEINKINSQINAIENRYDLSINALKNSINIFDSSINAFNASISNYNSAFENIQVSLNNFDSSIGLLNNATSTLDTKIDGLFSAMFSALNSIHSDTSAIQANTSSMINSINNLIENTSRNYTRITKLDDKIDDITSFTFDMNIIVDRHDASITKLNSSVGYIMGVLNTNPQDNLIVSTYNKTMFSKSMVCYYNPVKELHGTLWVNDMGSYNSIPAPDQYISFYGAAISSYNTFELDMYLLNVTADFGTFTINSANINTLNIKGGKFHNSYGLDGVFNSGFMFNASFESFDHLLIQKYAYHNLNIKDVNRCEIFDNTKLFYNINIDNVWMFQMTNSNTQNYTQSNLNINNVSIVSLSNLGSISSVNINNVYTYLLRNCSVNTCKINCTNTESNISTNTQVGFWGNNISLLSANNIANNMENNTIGTAVLEYNGYSHPAHKIISNSINAFYFQYYDYSMLEMFTNRIYDNTIVSLYLPVECNYYQTISDGTYDYSIINSISQYFKSNNNISYILPWFK